MTPRSRPVAAVAAFLRSTLDGVTHARLNHVVVEERDSAPIRLCLIVDTGFPTFRPDVAALYGRYLPRYGVIADLIGTRNSGAADWASGELLLAPMCVGGLRGRLGAFAHQVGCLLRTRRGRYAAILIRNEVLIAPLAMLRAWWLGIPFFFWMSYPVSEGAIRFARERGHSLGLLRWACVTAKGYIGHSLLHGLLLKYAAHVFVQSEKMRDDLAAKGVPLARMTAVPMGIDIDRFRLPVTPTVNARFAGRRIIAYLGTCDRIRRVDFLFEVVARLKVMQEDLLLLVIGDATEQSDRDWLRRRIAEFGVEEHVIVTGWVPPLEAQSYLAAAEIALALMPPDPLLDSTSPTKLVEYLAMMKPVVANDHPDQRRVLHESGAGICTDMDVARFAEAVQGLLCDGRRRACMSVRGRVYAETHRSYDVIAKRLAETYAALLAGGG